MVGSIAMALHAHLKINLRIARVFNNNLLFVYDVTFKQTIPSKISFCTSPVFNTTPSNAFGN